MRRRVRSPLTISNSRRHKTASDLHELWRAGRRRPEGGYEPRKKVIDGRTYDIANLSYSALPKQVRHPALSAAHRSHSRTSTAARHATHTHSPSLSCSRLCALSLSHSLARSLSHARTFSLAASRLHRTATASGVKPHSLALRVRVHRTRVRRERGGCRDEWLSHTRCAEPARAVGCRKQRVGRRITPSTVR